ncbi:MAG: hypothetical protein ACXVLQ_15145 [Bacteriovorax sp.]
MKKMMIFLMLLVAPAVFANQSVELSPISFHVSADDALSRFEQTILYPEGMLTRFRPVGAKISNKQVSQNEISFVATKNVLFISKSVHVNGVLESSEDKEACRNEDVGYSLKMHFDSSDALVRNNVEELQATICLHSQSATELAVLVQSRIIIGNNYSKAIGPIAINLIKKQVSPLLNALTEEIKSLR